MAKTWRLTVRYRKKLSSTKTDAHGNTAVSIWENTHSIDAVSEKEARIKLVSEYVEQGYRVVKIFPT